MSKSNHDGLRSFSSKHAKMARKSFVPVFAISCDVHFAATGVVWWSQKLSGRRRLWLPGLSLCFLGFQINISYEDLVENWTRSGGDLLVIYFEFCEERFKRLLTQGLLATAAQLLLKN